MDDRARGMAGASDAVGAHFPDLAPRLTQWNERLEALRANRHQASLESPVDLLANEISAAIDSGELSTGDLDRGIRALTLQAFLARAVERRGLP